MSSNIFQSRIEIGEWTDPISKKRFKVYPSVEFLRALASLSAQTGGTTGIDSDSLATLASFASAEDTPDQFVAPQEAGGVAEVAALREQLAQAVALLDGARAESQALASRLEAIEQLLAVPVDPTPLVARVEALEGVLGGVPDLAPIVARLEALEMTQQVTDTGTDWEHPGKLGFRVPNSGSVTTFTASGAVALSPANANVVISPTGTGAVTINPANVSTMNNVDIGTSTPKSIAGTTINSTLEMRSTQAIGGAYYGMWSTSANANSRNWTLGMNGVAFGQCELSISTARLGDPIAAGSVVWSATISGLKVTAGFGCNGKTAQTSAASGGALAAYVAGANGLDTPANMAALHAMVVAQRAALVANGIMS